MPKVNTDSLYFRQAANMLGEKEALRHLQIVAGECDNSLSDVDNENCPLYCLFVFDETPQGFDFWDLIVEVYYK